MLSQDRGEMLWQAASCRALSSWGCPQQELPEHTAARDHVTSWLALSFCFCLHIVMASTLSWPGPISPKLGAGFASL